MSQTLHADWQLPPLRDWQDTQHGLHLRTQIIGKTRLALAPPQNHWWHTALYVTARGLGTSLMPHGAGGVEIDLDFIDHVVVFRTSDGTTRTMPLHTQPIAEFYRDYLAMLRSLDIDIKLWPMPSEISDPIRFTDDRRPLRYDRAAVTQFFHVLLNVDRVLKHFREQFLGKCSPSHFWWGGFDHACTRFSGRRAPPHPGGIPNLPDYVTREAYSHECISAGWWPGTPGGPIQEAAFYAYAYPEPPGCDSAPVRPAGARYDTTMREWLLPQAAVAAAAEPDAYALEFIRHAYETAATLGAWNSELVRAPDPLTGQM